MSVCLECDTENPSLSFYWLIKRYPPLRKETDWLSKYSTNIVRYTLKGQAEAWHAFFKGLRDHPTFHNKEAFAKPQSFRRNIALKRLWRIF